MGFLAPGAFVAGGGLLLAILATYLLRPRRPARRVSSTFLWLAALHDLQAQRPWRRVPPSVLLLLQIAALRGDGRRALARPFLLSTESSGLEHRRPARRVGVDAGHRRRALALRGGARRAWRQMIDALEPGQTLALVSLDAQPRVVAPPSDDRAQLHRAARQPAADDAVGQPGRGAVDRRVAGRRPRRCAGDRRRRRQPGPSRRRRPTFPLPRALHGRRLAERREPGRRRPRHARTTAAA